MNEPVLQQNTTGQMIKAMRISVGASTRSLALALGCTRYHLHALESGIRPLTSQMSQRISKVIAERLNKTAA